MATFTVTNGVNQEGTIDDDIFILANGANYTLGILDGLDGVDRIRIEGSDGTVSVINNKGLSVLANFEQIEFANDGDNVAKTVVLRPGIPSPFTRAVLPAVEFIGSTATNSAENVLVELPDVPFSARPNEYDFSILTFNNWNVSENSFRINGGDGDEIIIGTVLSDSIRGAGGNDVIYGGLGDDLIRGGEGRRRPSRGRQRLRHTFRPHWQRYSYRWVWG